MILKKLAIASFFTDLLQVETFNKTIFKKTIKVNYFFGAISIIMLRPSFLGVC